MYFVTFDFVTLRRSIRCENSQSKILLLYNYIIITHNNSLLHFRKVLIVTNSHVTKAHIVLKRLTRTTEMVDSFPEKDDSSLLVNAALSMSENVIHWE